MWIKTVSVILLGSFLLSCSFIKSGKQPLKVLILDGQNNHYIWPKTTHMIKELLEDTGRFDVDIYRTQHTWMGGQLLDKYPLKDERQYYDLNEAQPDPSFSPNFSQYDVVISNFGWRASPWPETTKHAFEKYVSEGGGFVVIHAANNSFPEWDEYNQMIGIGGWGNRNESNGPYLYYDENEILKKDFSKGKAGGHGVIHQFEIKLRDKSHPIVSVLPSQWLHTSDELYNQLRGPAKNVTILATAYDDPKFNGSGRHEPVVMTIRYHEGRVFHTTLGHGEAVFQDNHFISLLQRGTEWAATGTVINTKIL